MSALTNVLDRAAGDDHWISFTIALLVIAVVAFVFSVPWYWLLVIGALVSGIVEMAIKEVPPDPENYDRDQYVLWNAAFGDKNTNTEEIRDKLQDREKNTNGPKSSKGQSDELDTLRDRYARGEITEEQFERKVETLLKTDTPEDAADWQTEHRETIKE